MRTPARSNAIKEVVELIRECGPMSLYYLREEMVTKYRGLHVMLRLACTDRMRRPQELQIIRWDWFNSVLGVRRRTPVYAIGSGKNARKPPPILEKSLQNARYHRRKMKTINSVFALGMSVKTRLRRRLPEQLPR